MFQSHLKSKLDFAILFSDWSLMNQKIIWKLSCKTTGENAKKKTKLLEELMQTIKSWKTEYIYWRIITSHLGAFFGGIVSNFKELSLDFNSNKVR